MDDDLWVDIVGIERHLRASLALAARLPRSSSSSDPPAIYWGSFTAMYFSKKLSRFIGDLSRKPMYWGHNAATVNCTQQRELPPMYRSQERSYAAFAASATASSRSVESVVGPFHFAKGALYCMSASLAQLLASDQWLQGEVDRLLAAPLSNALWPFEDVFVGYALAHTAGRAAKGASLLALDIGEDVFTDDYGMLVAPGTLIWHMKLKVPERIALLDTWMRTHHCNVGVERLQTRCDKQSYVSCDLAQWRRCTVAYPNATHKPLRTPSRCSNVRHNLLSSNFTHVI